MKKILFGITSLTLGGAERVLVDVANNLSKNFDITIFTLYSGGEFEKELSDKVKIKSVYNHSYKELTFIKRIGISFKLMFFAKSVYRKINKDEQFDTIIAFLEGPITRLFSNAYKNQKAIAWVHNDISKVFGDGLKAKIKKIYDKKIYSKFDNIVFVSNDNLEKFKGTYPSIKNEKLKLIYNYIDSKNIISKSNEDINIEFKNEEFNILTVARLTKQKAIDRLIDIHSKLIKEGLRHSFYVIGDGPEKESLNELIKNNKVDETFKLLGKRENPYPYIKKCDIFCLLSLYEGYGMVLEEAKILDKFIVITDTAAREAVKEYENSIIVQNNEKAIYSALKNIIENKEEYKSRMNSEKKYDNSNLIRKIEEIL